MEVNIILFGRLMDITGSKTIAVQGVADTDQLVQQLNNRYPAFTNAPYIIAVDKQVINANTVLSGNNTVALLPPYSGG